MGIVEQCAPISSVVACYSTIMRVLPLSFVIVLMGFSFVMGASAQTNAFTTNLMLGSSGPQVVMLQQILNRDPETRVASTGPGSPGNETSYFGPLTKAAVMRFQEKYASEVLAPAGLIRGSGYVGPYTIAKLNKLSVSSAGNTNSVVTSTPPSSPPTNSTLPPESNAPQNPNLRNLDVFLSSIDTVAAMQGVPAATVAAIKTQVAKDAATTTDLQTAFLGMTGATQNTTSQSSQSDSSAGVVGGVAIVGGIAALAGGGSSASGGTTAFGGSLLYSYYCNCSSTWLLTLSPLPPSFATLLTYTPGSQAYLSFNIPQTKWLLGQYSGGGSCSVYVGYGCISIPSQGMITSTVGSSAM